MVVAASSGCEPTDRGDPAEDPADRGRMESARVERARCRHADPADDLVACDDRRQRIAPVGARLLGGGERRRAITAETWLTESECVSSKSSPWQSIAFAKAAFAAGSRARVPITVACASPPSSAIVVRPSVATPPACAASPQPSVSRRWSFASARTSSGMSSSVSVALHRRFPWLQSASCLLVSGRVSVTPSSHGPRVVVSGNPSATSGAPRR